MEIFYKNKIKPESILNDEVLFDFDQEWHSNSNKLIFAENLQALKLILKKYDLKGKVDLIYIDPPFATNKKFKISKKRASTISMDDSGTVAYADTLLGADFLEFLRQRLIIAKEFLSEKGSIYLHIDYKIGHYVKVIMDEVFGIDNFRNDITRVKCNPKNFERKAYGNVKDMILFYSKTKDNIWNKPTVDYDEADINKLFAKKDINGRRYTTIPLHAPGETKNGETAKAFKGILPPKGRHWRCSPSELEKLDEKGLIEWSKNNVPRKIIYADEKAGKKLQDIWEYKDPQYPQYPTQKNKDLLRSIIKASSNEGGIVLDFFCGSGTSLIVAQELNRKWIGIDQSKEAIDIANKNLSLNKDLYSSEYDLISLSKK
ncbi:MAG: DNA methyltransferase [Opitutales bacterium]